MTQRCIAGGIWSKTISPKSRSSAPSPRDTTRQSKASAPTSTLPLRSSPQGKCQQTLVIPCPISDGIFGLLQDFIQGFVSCAPFPNQSAFIQHSYDGSAVAITPDFDPAIFDPASDIGVFLSEIIRLGFSCFDGLLGCWRRRI